MPHGAAAEKTGSAEHGDDATVRCHPLISARDSSIARAEADVRVMAVRLGKFANFLIKVKVIGFGGVTGMPAS
jgi:hypothetical protein